VKDKSPLDSDPPGHQRIEGQIDLFTQDGQFVCIHVPAARDNDGAKRRLLVVVHGYGARRNNARGRQRVRDFAASWGRAVEMYPWVVMAPHFDQKRFSNDYQRLNRAGLRADLRLNRLIKAIGAQSRPLNIDTQKIFLLGFSGGGQFVHRYVAFNGQRVSRAVVGAPGWFMWPDLDLPYPIGMGEPHAPQKGSERLRRLCRQEMLLLVGDRDRVQGAYRSAYHGIDLDVLQGRGRRKRAANWFAALEKAADELNMDHHCCIRILKNTYHRINRAFSLAAIDYLTGSGGSAKGNRNE
jgi:predicted esterase